MSVEVYLDRAEQLARARELLREDALYASATALLSVHAAIAMSDALLMCMNGARSKGRDHKAAIAALKVACGQYKVQQDGVRHLAALVSAKTDISYGDKSVSHEKAMTLAALSEKFQRWAYMALKEAKC